MSNNKNISIMFRPVDPKVKQETTIKNKPPSQEF